MPQTKIVENDLDDLLKSKINVTGIGLKSSFGAVGDGVADDTAAVALARQYIADTGNPVTVEPGVYLTSPFVMDITSYSRQGFFIGSDPKRCVFKRLGTGGSSFVQLGSSTQTSFQANFPMRFIGIDGGAKTNGPAFTGYDLVRAKIYGVNFTGGSTACRLLGGISVSFYGATFEAASRGLEVLNYVTNAGQVSPSGGGWPNLIKVYGGEIVDNSEWGVFFNGGRMLILDGVDIEGNGTTLGASQGGVYVGPNIGLEVSTSISISKGLILKNCWIEANRGVADVVLDSGVTTIEDCLFFSNSGMNQNDVLINGGRYRISRSSTAFSKTSNILETSAAQSGNSIDMCEFFNISYNPSKTRVSGGTQLAINGGSAVSGVGFSRPIEQAGSVDGTGGVSGTVTFPVAFKPGTAPKVFIQVQNKSDLATIDQPDIFNVSYAGFTYRKKSFNGTNITEVNYLFTWLAKGEAQ